MTPTTATEPTPAEYQATLAGFRARGIDLVRVHMVDALAVKYAIHPWKGGRRHFCDWHSVISALAALHGQTV